MASKTVNPAIFRPVSKHEVDGIITQRAGVSAVKKVPERFLIELAGAADVESRMLAARHSLTPVEQVAALAQDPSIHVRTAAASNTAATAEILAAILRVETNTGFLARRRNQKVRVQLHNTLSTHRNLDQESLAQLIIVAGPTSAAGRYAQERITLHRTKNEIAARKAKKAAATA